MTVRARVDAATLKVLVCGPGLRPELQALLRGGGADAAVRRLRTDDDVVFEAIADGPEPGSRVLVTACADVPTGAAALRLLLSGVDALVFVGDVDDVRGVRTRRAFRRWADGMRASGGDAEPRAFVVDAGPDVLRSPAADLFAKRPG
ncbi:MAG TPA: hypothetical protein VEI02_06540, partial [Planctomycetota bacterium]|nr:hypothetical protein [Planctomycetota bacterium]